MGKAGIAVAIIVTAIVVGIIGYAASNSQFASNIGLDKMLTNSKAIVPVTKPKEPIAIYNPCGIFYLGSKQDVYMEIKCYDTNTRTGIKEVILDVKLNPPDALKNYVLTTGIVGLPSSDVTLYKYSQTEYEIGIKDQVNEKRYRTTVWEFP